MWQKEIPKEEGWYWLKFRDKHNKFIKKPCTVIYLDDTTACVSAGGSFFTVENRKYQGFNDAKFWSEPIIIPED